MLSCTTEKPRATVLVWYTNTTARAEMHVSINAGIQT